MPNRSKRARMVRRCALGLLSTLMLVACGAARGVVVRATPEGGWARYSPIAPESAVLDEIPSDFFWISVEDARLVYQTHVSSLRDRSVDREILCYEELTQNRLPSGAVQLHTVDLDESGLRLIFWRGILVFETEDGSLLPFAACEGDCRSFRPLSEEIPSDAEVYPCDRPPVR